jgi:hypothetical protein
MGERSRSYFSSIPSWFEDVAEWARALSRQSVNRIVESSGAIIHGQGVQVISVYPDGRTSKPGRANRIQVRLPGSKCLTRTQLRRLLEEVRVGKLPPVEYSLLGEARNALSLGRGRPSVIDSLRNRC